MSTFNTDLDNINNICALTSEIIELAQYIRDYAKDSNVTNKCLLIESKTQTVRHKAQRMENRLRDYRSAITSLGFTRIPRTKRKQSNDNK